MKSTISFRIILLVCLSLNISAQNNFYLQPSIGMGLAFTKIHYNIGDDENLKARPGFSSSFSLLFQYERKKKHSFETGIQGVFRQHRGIYPEKLFTTPILTNRYFSEWLNTVRIPINYLYKKNISKKNKLTFLYGGLGFGIDFLSSYSGRSGHGIIIRDDSTLSEYTTFNYETKIKLLPSLSTIIGLEKTFRNSSRLNLRFEYTHGLKYALTGKFRYWQGQERDFSDPDPFPGIAPTEEYDISIKGTYAIIHLGYMFSFKRPDTLKQYRTKKLEYITNDPKDAKRTMLYNFTHYKLNLNHNYSLSNAIHTAGLGQVRSFPAPGIAIGFGPVLYFLPQYGISPYINLGLMSTGIYSDADYFADESISTSDNYEIISNVLIEFGLNTLHAFPITQNKSIYTEIGGSAIFYGRYGMSSSYSFFDQNRVIQRIFRIRVDHGIISPAYFINIGSGLKKEIKNKNYWLLGVHYSQGFQPILTGTFEFFRDNMPIGQGIYESNGSNYSIKLSYIFARSKKLKKQILKFENAK